MSNFTLESIENLPVQIKYLTETMKDDGWLCDQWMVTFKNISGVWNTNYFTGIGLRSKRDNGLVKPKIADILCSLINDASASNYNFVDWCSEYGYSDDSITALNTYKQCLETNTILNKYIDRNTLKQIKVLLKDY